MKKNEMIMVVLGAMFGTLFYFSDMSDVRWAGVAASLVLIVSVYFFFKIFLKKNVTDSADKHSSMIKRAFMYWASADFVAFFAIYISASVL